MPLLGRVRVEIYLPIFPHRNIKICFVPFEEELTYAFDGCSIVRGLEVSYLSEAGQRIPDRINLIYSDIPPALSTISIPSLDMLES